MVHAVREKLRSREIARSFFLDRQSKNVDRIFERVFQEG